jgi:hypothetical protein
MAEAKSRRALRDPDVTLSSAGWRSARAWDRHYIRAMLSGSKSYRCWSRGIAVLLDDAAEDMRAQKSGCVEVVQDGGLLVGVRR